MRKTRRRSNGRFFDADVDARSVRVGSRVAGKLPDGYTKKSLAEDLVSVFREPPPARRHVRDVAHEWQARLPSPLVRGEAVRMAKFFARFGRSALRQRILDACGGDAVQAASLFLHALETVLETTGDMGMAGALDALGAIVASADSLGIEIPFAPPDDDRTAGKGHRALLSRALRVSELIPKLAPKYEPLARRVVKHKTVPWPDDIEIEPIRSLSASDLARVVTVDHLCTDSEFVRRVAYRSLRQVVYCEPVPEPPKTVTMLIDVSGSMDQSLPSGHKRSEYAIASAICLLRAGLRGGHTIRLVRFDDEPFPALEGTPAAIEEQLMLCEFSGGGTKIDSALSFADAEGSDEIILVTDGDDTVSYEPSARLSVYLCADRDSESLQRIADYYERVKGGE